MTSQIKCPYCEKLFEPSEAFKHELEEKLSKETQTKHKEEIERINFPRPYGRGISLFQTRFALNPLGPVPRCIS